MIKRVFKSAGKLFTGVLQVALGWLMPSQSTGGMGFEVDISRPDYPIPVVYGLDEVQAKPIFKHVTDGSGGPKRKYLNVVYAICEGPIGGIDEVLFNDVPSTDNRYRKNTSEMWHRIETRNGQENQAAFSNLISESNGLWTINHRGRGVALLYVRYELDKDNKVWRSGEPRVTVRVRGKQVRDLRTDTVSYSDNGPMCLYDYLTNSIYGYGVRPSRISQQNFMSAADRTDAGVESTVTRYNCWYDEETRSEICAAPTTEVIQHPLMSCNITLDTENTGLENIRTILSGMRAALPPSTGQYKLLVEDEGDSVCSLNESDIIGDVDYTAPEKRSRFNQVTVRYINKDSGFKADEVTYPDRGSDEFQTWYEEDNQVILSHSAEMPTIKNTAEALQMAEIICKISRLAGTAKFKVRKRGHTIGLECEDIIDINYALYGWEGRKFRVKEIDDHEETLTLEVADHEDAVYPWSDKDYAEIDNRTNLGDPWNVDPPRNLSIDLDTSLTTTGTLRWDFDNDAFVNRFLVRLSRFEDSVLTEVLGEEVTTRRFTIPRLDAGGYQVEVMARTSMQTESQAAVLMFDLLQPVPPHNLGLSATNNSVTAEPFLSGAGLGTVYEYDIDDLLNPDYEPTPRLRGGSAVFTGRRPNYEYRVWCRAVNALGTSAWTYGLITTTLDVAEQAPIVQQILAESPIIEDVVKDITQRTERSKQRIADARVSVIQELNNLLALDKESKKRKTAILNVQKEVETETSALVQQVQAVQANVNDQMIGFSAVVQRVEIDLNGVSSVVTALVSEFEDLEGDVFANAELLLDVEQTANGAANALANLSARVESTEEEQGDFAQALLSLNSDMNSLSARGFFGTQLQSNGRVRVTGIVVQDDGEERVIELAGDVIRFVRPDGTSAIVFSTELGEFVFDGRVTARSIEAESITSDKLSANAIDGKVFRGVTMVLADPNLPFMSVYGTGFGDENQFIEWYGPRNSTTWNNSTGYPRYNNLSYGNATYFRDKNGQYTQDVRRVVGNGSGTSVSAQHLSQGNLNTISGRVAFTGAMTYVETGQPLPSPTSGTASITIEIRRGTNVLATVTRTTTWQWNFAGAGGEERTLSVSGVADIDADDTRPAGNVTYSITRGSVSGLPRPITISYDSRIATLEIRE